MSRRRAGAEVVGLGVQRQQLGIGGDAVVEVVDEGVEEGQAAGRLVEGRVGHGRQSRKGGSDEGEHRDAGEQGRDAGHQPHPGVLAAADAQAVRRAASSHSNPASEPVTSTVGPTFTPNSRARTWSVPVTWGSATRKAGRLLSTLAAAAPRRAWPQVPSATSQPAIPARWAAAAATTARPPATAAVPHGTARQGTVRTRATSARSTAPTTIHGSMPTRRPGRTPRSRTTSTTAPRRRACGRRAPRTRAAPGAGAAAEGEPPAGVADERDGRQRGEAEAEHEGAGVDPALGDGDEVGEVRHRQRRRRQAGQERRAGTPSRQGRAASAGPR